MVYASCPLCIVTVGGGLLIAKKLGVDDLLISIWISGLNTAIAFWFAGKVKNRLLGNPVFMSMLFYLFTISYFLYTEQINQKILMGLTIGIGTFFTAMWSDKLIRSKNRGKPVFPYQKVLIPLILLLTVTMIARMLV